MPKELERANWRRPPELPLVASAVEEWLALGGAHPATLVQLAAPVRHQPLAEKYTRSIFTRGRA